MRCGHQSIEEVNELGGDRERVVVVGKIFLA
jgi:hypothetical protein